MAEYNVKRYFENHLNELKDKRILNLCIVDYLGNRTKWITLNNDSIEVLIEFLEAQKTIENE